MDVCTKVQREQNEMVVTRCKSHGVIWRVLSPKLQTKHSSVRMDFHCSLTLAVTLISPTLMLFGIRKRTLSVMITKSCTSGLSRVAAERWLAYCIGSWKPKLALVSLTTPLQINWPKFWATSVGAEMADADGQSVCVCAFVCKSVWQWQHRDNNNLSFRLPVKDASLSWFPSNVKQISWK